MRNISRKATMKYITFIHNAYITCKCIKAIIKQIIYMLCKVTIIQLKLCAYSFNYDVIYYIMQVIEKYTVKYLWDHFAPLVLEKRTHFVLWYKSIVILKIFAYESLAEWRKLFIKNNFSFLEITLFLRNVIGFSTQVTANFWHCLRNVIYIW